MAWGTPIELVKDVDLLAGGNWVSATQAKSGKVTIEWQGDAGRFVRVMILTDVGGTWQVRDLEDDIAYCTRLDSKGRWGCSIATSWASYQIRVENLETVPGKLQVQVRAETGAGADSGTSAETTAKITELETKLAKGIEYKPGFEKFGEAIQHIVETYVRDRPPEDATNDTISGINIAEEKRKMDEPPPLKTVDQLLEDW
jgi:hypothetical protein